jgi:iron(III) transport system ATP-binding protein
VSHLSADGVWKGYGGRAVLQGVSLDVPAGSLTAVLGLSGCGKTTLMRVIAGFERAERGQVTLAGVTLDDGQTYVAPETRSIGYVPQEGALFPHLTVRENVGFGLSRRERRGPAVASLLEMVGIAPLEHRLPHELSGGEQQRVALARALARGPQALLLDEPFSSLDAALRTHLREEVQALLRKQGVTTVLVTHDQEEALSLADSVAVLRDGTVVQQGSPAELYQQPVDERLASFLGAVNVVQASYLQGSAHTSLGSLALRGERPTGDGGVVMIRPEQLQVAPHEGESREGVLCGRVEQCRYYGHDALLYIRPEQPAEQDLLLARVHGEDALAVGTRVSVTAHGSTTALS